MDGKASLEAAVNRLIVAGMNRLVLGQEPDVNQKREDVDVIVQHCSSDAEEWKVTKDQIIQLNERDRAVLHAIRTVARYNLAAAKERTVIALEAANNALEEAKIAMEKSKMAEIAWERVESM